MKEYTKPFVIALIGAGQLGSRYLQGLAYCQIPLDIFVVDPSEASLATAKARWGEVVSIPHSHNARYSTTLNDLPASLDLCLVTTTADVRLQVVKRVQSHCNVRYWVLEKVLAQSKAQLAGFEDSLNDAEGVWVNTPMRAMDWYGRIRDYLKPPLEAFYGPGNWGLACNAIHYLDLFAWWTNESVLSCDISGLQEWIPSKRKGFWEVTGTLQAIYSGGSRFSLSVSEGSMTLLTVKTSLDEICNLDEKNGSFTGPNNVLLPGRFELQSEMSGPLVGDILLGGKCQLPSLVESLQIHRILINGLLQHWNESQQRDDSILPIT